MRIVRNISRFVIAVVFIFSGIVKAIDPLGSTYKFSDYFEVFGLDFLSGLSLPLAILLSSAELIIGLCLLFKIRIRVAAWALLIFMGFFTLLTLYLAIANPVTDCGCFGDAIILTNWQTFFKNIIFLIPTFVVFQQRNKYEIYFTSLNEWLMTGALFVASLLLSVYCLRNLPIIDFRPYRIGTDISAGMLIPKGMPVDQYKTILIYEKEGIHKEFSLDSPAQPWSDTSWSWVETKNILVSKGYEPPIHDFSLTSRDGDDYTDSLLTDSGFSFLVLAYDLEKSNTKGLSIVAAFMQEAIKEGYPVYGMTASLDETINSISGEHNLPFEFYTTDDISLKTIIRSNPGVLLIKEGVVFGKWHYRNIPDDDFFSQKPLSYALEEIVSRKNNYLSIGLVLIIGLAGIFIYVLRGSNSYKLSN